MRLLSSYGDIGTETVVFIRVKKDIVAGDTKSQGDIERMFQPPSREECSDGFDSVRDSTIAKIRVQGGLLMRSMDTSQGPMQS